MERINILWTGGFDSTYRICQLSLLDVEIQPYYVSFDKRSEPNELRSMADICNNIRSRKETKCVLLPVKAIRQNEIIKDSEIVKSFFALFSEAKFGDQYVWLASFAKQQGLLLEVGFEDSPSSNDDVLLKKYGFMARKSLPVTEDSIIEFYELDPEKSSKDLYNLFGHFRFSLPLFHMKKLQILNAYRKEGFEDIVPLTWFCAYPVFGKPCGLCKPCETVMKEKMGFRIPFVRRLYFFIFKGNCVGRFIEGGLKRFYNKHWRKLEVSA